jgi:phosphatidylserine decarboxylase
MGRFRLGSTVILLFPPGLIELDAQLMLDKDVRMGQAFGWGLKDRLRES